MIQFFYIGININDIRYSDRYLLSKLNTPFPVVHIVIIVNQKVLIIRHS